ncbi:MAG: hypothetical protein XD75_0596 [Parcubacteria bacterium 33_209]|nr:MAG: hypothetical protein XD75_0596 [Parcubacteria bacterium 33_209]
MKKTSFTTIVKEKNEWLELADGYEKEIQWKH